jgi:hypothetical protein
VHSEVTALVAFGAIVIACGARTSPLSRGEEDAIDRDGSSADGNASDVAADRGPSGPCMVDGVRVCGGGCPWLSTPECPGRGCTAVFDVVSAAPEGAGVCWADAAPGGGVDLCFACHDGDACVLREPDKLVCIDIAVCAKLKDLGAGGACRYVDKQAYDGRALLTPPATCPIDKSGSVQAALCGGGCGGCPSWTSGRCSGRSATRGFGVCAYNESFGPLEPIAVCSVDANGKWTRPCKSDQIDNGPYPREPAVCEVYANAGALDDAAARTYGLCVPLSVCQAAAHAVGGLHCFNPLGLDLHG